MMGIRSLLLYIFGIFSSVFILIGCIGGTSQEPDYFLLTASQKLPSLQNSVFETNIGIGPVKLPVFLDRPEIVTRKGENQLIISEFHRWGDSLEAQINHVLAENLSTQLGGLNVVIYPWERALAPTYQLYIDFRQFDGTIGGIVTMKAMWWVVETADDKRLFSQRSSIIVPVHNETFESYVIAQNIAIEKLSIEIAEVLINMFNHR